MSMYAYSVVLIAPNHQLKTVKDALDANRALLSQKPVFRPHQSVTAHSTISFIFKCLSERLDSNEILPRLGLDALEDVTVEEIGSVHPPDEAGQEFNNIVEQVVFEWLKGLETDTYVGAALDQLRRSFGSSWPKRYVIYRPMLLFSQGSFEHAEWRRIFDDVGKARAEELWERICVGANVTHIAVNAPIQQRIQDRPDVGRDGTIVGMRSDENILRSPTKLLPLYGDFGPCLTTASPTRDDRDSAFWVQTTQNGIVQCWAPRYTMFSRGNVKEKSRLLTLPSVLTAVEDGRVDEVQHGTRKGSCAVDLFAGIGYFAFSYAKVGVDKVLCWELNPWSVDGLIRGASKNGWACHVEHRSIDGRTEEAELQRSVAAVEDENIKFLIFNRSNEVARDTMRTIGEYLPPIRHVNCGLLPTSRGSWDVAVRLVDAELGGWLHVHENLAVEDIDVASKKITAQIQGILEGRARSTKQGLQLSTDSTASVCLEHVERVKTYAPGVMHCVLDVRIPPIAATQDD